MGKFTNDWQDMDSVLKMFDQKVGTARRKYNAFVKKGISEGKRPDLIGGGLIRSAGGWSALKAQRRAKIYQKGDERILGDGNFVEKILNTANETMKHNPDYADAWRDWGVALEKLERYEEAIKKFKEALKHKPDFVEAKYNWGVALWLLGRHEKAIEKQNEALKHKPDLYGISELLKTEMKLKKVGRIEPCPCGSGFKFKKCCGR